MKDEKLSEKIFVSVVFRSKMMCVQNQTQTKGKAMTQDKFLNSFAEVARNVNWNYEKNRFTSQTPDGKMNPVTFLAKSMTGKVYPATKRGTLRAARSIGVTQELASAIYCSSNRGHAQIIRGKISKLLSGE
jgi:hypothetical protein